MSYLSRTSLDLTNLKYSSGMTGISLCRICSSTKSCRAETAQRVVRSSVILWLKSGTAVSCLLLLSQHLLCPILPVSQSLKES